MRCSISRSPVSLAAVALASLVATGSGCDLTDPAFDDFDDVESIDAVAQSIVNCPVYECGNNAAKILGNGLADLHLGYGRNQIANRGDYVFDGYVHGNGVPMHLSIEGYELVARPFPRRSRGPIVVAGPRVEYRGSELVGGKLLFRKKNSSLQHALRIAAYLPARLWVAPHDRIPSFKFVAVENAQTMGGVTHPLCDYQPAARPTRPRPGTYQTASFGGPTTLALPADWREYAVVFTGDRYDGNKLTINTAQGGTGGPGGVYTSGGPHNGVDDWVNFGCLGYAGAKLLALRHAEASTTNSYKPTVFQRQALLKALTGAVWGDKAMTATGTPLWWRMSAGEWDYDQGAPIALEGIWDHNGAVCLTKFRLDGSRSYQSAMAENGAVRPCTFFDYWSWPSLGHVVTAVPQGNPAPEDSTPWVLGTQIQMP